MNRTGDFRASGSGVIDWNPELIDPGAIRLAFKVAEQLQTDSLAIDILYKGTVPVVAEISYTYASWAVAKCPGHWVHTRESIEKLSWVHGSLRPEDAIFEDFLHKINEA